MAASLDGRIASQPGESDQTRRSLGFTNADDREHLRGLLVEADAVIVGASSLVASGGAWELTNDRGVLPLWAVLTNSGLPADTRFLQQERVPRWLVSKAPLPGFKSSPTLKNLVYDDAPPASVLAAALATTGAERVLLFGGGEVNRVFYQEGLVDELILTLCPLLVGSEAAIPLVKPPLLNAVRFTLLASQVKGNLVFLTYKVQKD